MSSPLVYEVTLDIQADTAVEFDAWLKDHVRHMLALPGFHDARILKPEGPEPGTERRVVQYTLGSRGELDQYLAEHAPRMREDGVKRFGDKMKASRRVFDLDTPVAGSLALPGLVLPAEGPRCRNCGTPLTGKFCMECGQKNHTYVAPLWNVLQDFAATHFGFDTKFFHSIVPLLFRPGFLTREYCLGHEERYVKPFRLYLFTSIVFFFLAAIFWPQLSTFGGGDKLTVNGKPVATSEGAAPKQTKDETRNQIQNALQQIDVQPGDPGAKTFAKTILQDELASLDKAPAPATVTAANAATGAAPRKSHFSYSSGVKSPAPSPASGQTSLADGLVQIDTGDSKGTKDDADENRITRAFEKLRDKDAQEEFKKKLGQNMPKMVFALMPLIAIFLKLFYIRSKRYLTEHFVFTLHFHAMAFTVMLIVMLLGSLSQHVSWLTPLGHKLGTLAAWYIAIYLFLALRFFYKQGWFMTGLKFFLLFISYSIAIGLTFAAGAVLTAVEL